MREGVRASARQVKPFIIKTIYLIAQEQLPPGAAGCYNIPINRQIRKRIVSRSWFEYRIDTETNMISRKNIGETIPYLHTRD